MPPMRDRLASKNSEVVVTHEREPRTKTQAGTEVGTGLNAPVKSDGTLGTDGMRLRAKVWQNCVDCGKPIYFVRIGSRCITCGRKQADSITNEALTE